MGGDSHTLGRETCVWLTPPRGATGPEPRRAPRAGPGHTRSQRVGVQPSPQERPTHRPPSERLHPGHALPLPTICSPRSCYFEAKVKATVPVSTLPSGFSPPGSMTPNAAQNHSLLLGLSVSPVKVQSPGGVPTVPQAGEVTAQTGRA